MNDTHTHTLLEAAKKNWRSFLPSWIFPIIFFYGGKIADRLNHAHFFFFVVAIPLFFLSYSRASIAWTKREINYRHAVLMGLVTPFAIWVVVVFIQSAITGLPALPALPAM